MSENSHAGCPLTWAAARSPVVVGLCLALAAGAVGCSGPSKGPVVFYLDGAGWYSSAGSVKQGMRDAGYTGRFETFSWSAYLGPAHDHLITTKSKAIARRLARKIEKVRTVDPTGRIDIMGLSAGTAVILSALEQLPPEVAVDNVVLLSSSVSAGHDLTPALRHVRRNLYATCSPHDGILSALPINADGKSGLAAGQAGFRLADSGENAEAEYRKVINLPWRPAYLAYDWDGGHTSVTGSMFVASVIAPRLLITGRFPLDRSITEKLFARRDGGEP